MAGISSKALKSAYVQNKRLFNEGNEIQNNEFSDGNGLELYDATYRMYDAQIGRFLQIDPLTDLSLDWSGYVFSSNNPITRNDPLGLQDKPVYKDLPEIIIKSVRKKANAALNWFTGGAVGYTGSGWGHGPRRWLADKIGLGGYANNLFQLGLHSQLQSDQVALGGDLLKKLKEDQAMIVFQNRIIKLLKADPRFGKIRFVRSGKEVVEFGGKRAPGDMVEQLKDPLNSKYADTWKVAGNELTWAVRHAGVSYTAVAKADGTIVIAYKLNDSLDLSKQDGRSGAYNTISSGLGFLYHDVAGGNTELKVKADWQSTIK